MRIVCVQLYPLEVPMGKPIKMAGETLTHAQTLLVRLIDERGFEGWGEASAAPLMTGETLGSIAASTEYLVSKLVGERVAGPPSIALLQEREIRKALNEPLEVRSASTLSRLKSVAEPLVKYMLFAEEAAFDAPIKGSSNFTAEFQARGPKDPHGRSLRDLDLDTRLLKHPCSYLVYSEEFDRLPELLRNYIVERLSAIFSGKDDAEYKRLTPADRDAIREILAATWKHAPAAWKEARASELSTRR